MKVHELIKELQKVGDKNLDVVLSYEYGEDENRDPIEVEYITERPDCVTINI